MGASTSIYEPNGQLKPYPYPYNYFHKVWQFPWKFYFTNSKAFRSLLISASLMAPIIYKGQLGVRSKKNKEVWAEKRKTYEHTYFDPPKPPVFKARTEEH